MSKKLKSFHKLFFIIIFSIIFSGVIGSGNSPDLPEKIAPELEQIEALPRRTKPAELNIEVTKIKSEPLEDVYIDRKNKNIYVDFSKKREQTLRGVKDAEELEKKYNLVVSETVQGTNEVNGRKKSSRNTSSVMDYEVVEYQGKKVLKIPYENEPEKIYISVQDSGNEKLAKIYVSNIEKAIDINNKDILIEERKVIINLKNGIETYLGKKIVFNLNGSLNFDGIENEQGTSNTILTNEVKVEMANGFINSFPQNTDIIIKTSEGREANSSKTSNSKSGDMQLYFDNPNPIQQDGFVFNFYKGGELSLRFQQIGSVGKKTYQFNIRHISNGQIKNHTLIINSGLQTIKKREATVTYLKGYDNIQSDFDIKGLPNRSILKTTIQSLNGEFVTGLAGETYITAQQIDEDENPIGIPLSIGRTSVGDFAILNMPDVTINFLRNDGQLRLSMKTLDNTKSYRYKITHRNSNSSNGNIIMEDILNINNEFIEKAEVTLKYKNNYIYDWYKFDLNGNITFGDSNNLTVEKITDNFIKTMPFISNLEVPRIVATEENTGKSVELTYQEGILKGVLKFDNEMDICLVFSPDGHFEFNVGGKLVPKSKYKIRLKHKDSNNKLFKEQILNIQEYDIKNIIEKKEVTVSYLNGYQSWLGFDENGIVIEGQAEVKKHNFQEGFIEGFRYYCTNNHSHDKNILKISSPSIKTINYDLRTDNGLYLDVTIKTIDGAIIVLRYYCNPNPKEAVLHLYMNELPENGNRYRFYITHTNNKGDIKEHILNIGDLYEKEEKEVSLYLTGATNNDIIFDENGAILNSNDNPTIIVKKHNFNEGFITGFKQENCQDVHSTIKIDGINISNIYDMGHQSSNSIYGTYRRVDIQIKNNTFDAFSLFFYCNGKNIGIHYPKINSNETNRIYITHIQRNKIKEHILNIYPASAKINRISNLKNYEVEDNENLETNIVNKVNFGSLEMQINNGVISFPSLALGNQSGDNGWGFSSSIPLSPRKIVEARFESQYQVPVKVQMFFENKSGNLNVIQRQDESEKLPTFIGKIKENEKSILVDLKGKLSVDNNFKDILDEFRQGIASEVILSSKDSEQISFVIGSEIQGTYKAPSMNLIDIPVVRERYPNIVIKKPPLENENILLDLNENMLNKSIQFKENMESSPDFIIKSDSNKFFKSLWYKSTFTLNDSIYRRLESTGNSVPFDIELVDLLSGNKLLLEIQYIDKYPRIKIKSGSEEGKYILNINHYNSGEINNINTRFTKEKRKSFRLEINYFINKDNNDFKINKNINEIIIRKEKENYIVEYPENKINMIQQTKDSKLFPVIALNSKDKWEINTTSPFNLTDKRPWSSFDIGENIKVSTSLKETPYQNKEKFFIYNRGELSNRNIAVGAYNNEGLEGDKNRVEIDLKLDFSQEVLEKFWNYSQKFSENKVLIPYSLTDNEIHKIYAIKGVLNNNQFDINSLNILEEIDFPKVYVLKGKELQENIAILTFENPIPKSGVNLKGSFDINANGLKLPNDMPHTLRHPESLSINGITSAWQGYSKINEYHEIDIKVLRNGVTNFIKTITTNIDGTLKDNIEIKNEEKYSYVLKKGKNSLIAIGIETWDLNETTQYEEILILEHKNSSGRVTHIDKYKIIIRPFNIFTYLALPIPDNNTITKSIETETQRIPLIDFQLKNYDKDLTIKSIGFDQGVKIELNLNDIELVDISNPNNKVKGKLNFVGDKTVLISPNEIGNLEFNITYGVVANGKTYQYKGQDSLVRIKTHNLSKSLVKKLEITGTAIGSNLNFPYFNAKSNLKNIIINDNLTISNSGLDLSMGTVSLQQNGSAPSSNDIHINYSFPTIALGDESGFGWGVNGGAINNEVIRKNVYTKYYFESNPTTEILLRTFIGNYSFLNYRSSYIRKDQDNKVVITGCYGWSGDVSEKVTSEIKVNFISEILERAREIKGNRIILKAKSGINDNKIALIHSRIKNTIPNTVFLPTDNTNVLVNNRVRYFSYKDIIIEKDSFTKNLKLKFLKTYIGNTKIKFGKDSIITSDLSTKGVELSFYEKGALYGLEFKNKIKISSLDETIIQGQTEYDIDAQGKLVTPIEIKMIKNGAEAILNLDYDNLDALLSLKGTKLEEEFNIALDYIEASGDIRRKYNLSLATSGENTDVNYKKGEIDLTISSRYNPIDGQLNSEPILITKDGVKYQTEVLDLKLLNGDYPIELKENQKAYINGEEIFLNESYTTVTLNKGTIIKAKQESNGDLKIKPIYWNYNTEDEFILEYKKESIVTNQYKFNVKCPEFFVASSGVLDFGKLYQFGNPQDKIVTTNIELNYNTNVNAEYSLDISQGELAIGTDIFKNYLYLDDNKTLLVKDLFLGEEVGKETTKRTLPLTGTIHGPSILKASEGKYEKTIQILIHLK